MQDLRDDAEARRAMLLGIGLDHQDGHLRVTAGENFRLLGGSAETHERMVETTVKFNEKVKQRGKTLEQLERDEFHDLMGEATE